MKSLVTLERISCDMCGQAMGSESSKIFIEGVYLGEKYANAIIDISAICFGREYKCLCNDCRKKLLESAINSLGG